MTSRMLGPSAVKACLLLAVALATTPSAASAASIEVHEFVVTLEGKQGHTGTATRDEGESGVCGSTASSTEDMAFRAGKAVRMQVHRRGRDVQAFYRAHRGWSNQRPMLLAGTVTRNNSGFLACNPERDCGTHSFTGMEASFSVHRASSRQVAWGLVAGLNRESQPILGNCGVVRDTERSPAGFPLIWDRRGSMSDIDAKFLYTKVPNSKIFNRRVRRFTVKGVHSETYATPSASEGYERVSFTQSLTYTLRIKRVR